MVKVTAPLRAPRTLIEKIIAEKKQWITTALKTISHKKLLPKPKTFNDFLTLKRTTKQVVVEKIKQYNAYYNFEYKNIAIKTGTSRWGSCSSQKNLNFHYSLALLPDHLQDYLVVHELCHLAHMNHSINFWKKVSEQIPRYKQAKKELSEYAMPE